MISEKPVFFTFYVSEEAVTRDTITGEDVVLQYDMSADSLAYLPRVGDTVVSNRTSVTRTGVVNRVVFAIDTPSEITIYVDCVISN